MREDARECSLGSHRRSFVLGLTATVLLVALATSSSAQETWTATSTTNAPSARHGHAAVWTGSKMVVWGGEDYSLPAFNTGGVYDAATDTWTSTSTTSAPTGRSFHTAVWTGSKMVVWGGQVGSLAPFNTGGVYEPATDTWTSTSTTSGPIGRVFHTAVWTGSKMIVWGGGDGILAAFNTGGVYDVATNTWTATSTTAAPTARSYHTAVWTGSKMIVWGGGVSDAVNTGGIYDPAADTWTAMSTTNAPSARAGHSAVWVGSKMVVWGGIDLSGWVNTGGIYDPATDTWTATSTANAPPPSSYHTAVWTGSKMIVWGGYDGSTAQFEVNTGGIYDPATDTWTATSTTNAPSARYGHSAVWTGSNMVVWGGQGSSGELDTGRVYSNPVVVPPLPSPADFYTVTPCRLIDTRNAAGPSGGPALVAGAVRSFPVTDVCGIPSTATAVSVTLTAVQPAAPGHLILYPGDAAGPPLVSNINFTSGVTRAGNAVALLATNGGTINVKNGSAGSVHLVLDVNGYFQ